MPVVVMHGGGGNCTHASKATGPNSHLGISFFGFILNPVFGLFALFFACWSRKLAAMDWERAQVKGRIALWLTIAGIIITVVVGLVLVLLLFTKDT